MTLTFAEAVRKLEHLRQRRTIWMDVVDHLSRYIDHEVSKAEHTLMTDGSIDPQGPKIPQHLIQKFIDDISEGEIGPLNKEISALEGLSVTEKEDDEETPVAKTTKPKIGKGDATVAKAGRPKGVRVIPPTPRSEAGGNG